MTSSESKMCLWIFCPQMTLHDIPKIPQIGVKGQLSLAGYAQSSVPGELNHR